MVGPEIIFQHFPNLTEEQKTQFTQLGPLYADHNARVNVISRKDMDMFYIHHVLHSMALAKTCELIDIRLNIHCNSKGYAKLTLAATITHDGDDLGKRFGYFVEFIAMLTHLLLILCKIQSMRKIIIGLSIVVSSIGMAQAQTTIKNGGLENWRTSKLIFNTTTNLETPQGWSTFDSIMNVFNFMSGGNTQVKTQVTKSKTEAARV